MKLSEPAFWVKICGLTCAEQAIAIADCGATALGFICVSASPRYVSPAQMGAIAAALQQAGHEATDRVGVFANAELADVLETARVGQLTALQLHGQESLAYCHRLRQAQPQLKLIKAFRIRTPADLQQPQAYAQAVDILLLDAYHPERLGGTGRTLDWQALRQFQPGQNWVLAGGLTPDNVPQALQQLSPQGIDLSSGVEIAPGDKDLARVKRLFEILRGL